MFAAGMAALFALGVYQFWVGLGFLLMIPVVGLLKWSCYRELARSRRLLNELGQDTRWMDD